VPSVDATPVSLLEAMACGSPPVVSSLASALEWVEDGTTGLVVAPRDQEALENAILRLIDSGELRESIAAAAAAKVQTDADHGAHMARMEQLCEELVRNWRR